MGVTRHCAYAPWAWSMSIRSGWNPPLSGRALPQSPAEAPRPVASGGELAGRKVLIIVDELPVQCDRRVWQEAGALRDAGAAVSIICPTGKGYETRYEVIADIHVYLP